MGRRSSAVKQSLQADPVCDKIQRENRINCCYDGPAFLLRRKGAGRFCFMNERKFKPSFYIFCFLILLALWLISQAETAGAQQPNPQACNSMTETLLPLIESKQQDQMIYSGRLFQGLPTHSEIPATSAIPDQAYNQPTDQPISWVEFLGADMPAEMPCRYTIMVYDSPEGSGYDVTIEYVTASRGRDPVVCNRVEARGAKARGRGKDWTCGE